MSVKKQFAVLEWYHGDPWLLSLWLLSQYVQMITTSKHKLLAVAFINSISQFHAPYMMQFH